MSLQIEIKKFSINQIFRYCIFYLKSHFQDQNSTFGYGFKYFNISLVLFSLLTLHLASPSFAPFAHRVNGKKHPRIKKDLFSWKKKLKLFAWFMFQALCFRFDGKDLFQFTSLTLFIKNFMKLFKKLFLKKLLQFVCWPSIRFKFALHLFQSWFLFISHLLQLYFRFIKDQLLIHLKSFKF